MPPLTIDADGWFTVTADAKPEPSTPSPKEKPQDDVQPVSPIQWNRRPSICPARKRDPAATRSPSGWIIAVEDVRREENASSPVDKPVDDVVTVSSDSSKSRPVSSSIETQGTSKADNAHVTSKEAVDSAKDEKFGFSSYEKPLDETSAPISTPSSLEPPNKSHPSKNTTRDRPSGDYIAVIDEARSENPALTSASAEKQAEKLTADDASTASSSSRTSSFAGTSITSTSSADELLGDSHDSEKATDTTPVVKEATETTSITSTASTSTGSSAVASTSSSSDGTPKKLRPRARSSPPPIPTLGIDPKILVGKVLTHIRRSPDHPTVTLSFADGTTYQILVDGYDPRNTSGAKPESRSTSRSCILEMDEVLLRMLEVPGRHVVDREITDCAHIRLADKALERREWEQSWTQSHVAVAFKFAGESRWHCVWAMRAEYDERGCIFRAFDDVYLQVLDRQLPRSPQKKFEQRRLGVPSPLKSPKSPGRIDTSTLRTLPKPPPSPTAMRSKRSPSKTPKKNGLLKTESWKKDT
ncbi:hypothetical protein ACEPAI_7735 [Sanghuangporus weigelae]